MAGVTLQIGRDWVVKFNAHGPGGLIDRKPPGQPSRLTHAHRTALMARFKDGPIPSGPRFPSRPSAVRCGHWAIASSTLVRVITQERGRGFGFQKEFPARLEAITQQAGGQLIVT